MALVESRITESGVVTYDKVAVAIQLLKDYEQMALAKSDSSGENGYYVCISGGKDSSVIQELCIMAGVKCTFYHNHTGIDHPETVYFVRRERQRLKELGYTLKITYPKQSMWALVRKKGMLPTRKIRYCCSELKEGEGKQRFVVTGVRRAESNKRSGEALVYSRGKSRKDVVIIQNDNTEERRSVESCALKGKLALNVIVDWSDSDVWEFIRTYNVPYNPLYDMGYKRVGCIGCPMSAHVRQELDANPKYKAMWIRMCEYLVKTTEKRHKTAKDLYDWWTEKDKKSKNYENQIEFELEDNE